MVYHYLDPLMPQKVSELLRNAHQTILNKTWQKLTLIIILYTINHSFMNVFYKHHFSSRVSFSSTSFINSHYQPLMFRYIIGLYVFLRPQKGFNLNSHNLDSWKKFGLEFIDCLRRVHQVISHNNLMDVNFHLMSTCLSSNVFFAL